MSHNDLNGVSDKDNVSQPNAFGRAATLAPGRPAPTLRAVTPTASLGRTAARGPVAAPRANSTTAPTAPTAPPRTTSTPAATAPAAERVRTLFDEALPRRILERGELYDRVHGTLSVFVEGAGSWCLRFGDHQHPEALTAAGSFESDAVVVFTVARFVALLDGDAQATPTVALGDTTLLGRLGQLLLEPTRGALGARLYGPASSRK
jgi:hypothetical protein